MNEIDKITLTLSRIIGWLNAAKESEGIRREMFSAAEKTCENALQRIRALNQPE